MRIYVLREFAKWAKKARLLKGMLHKAAMEIELGMFEADLGAGLFKKRVAAKGIGKRGGSRVLVAYKCNKRLIFLHGFDKKQKDNLTPIELIALKKIG